MIEAWPPRKPCESGLNEEHQNETGYEASNLYRLRDRHPSRNVGSPLPPLPTLSAPMRNASLAVLGTPTAPMSSANSNWRKIGLRSQLAIYGRAAGGRTAMKLNSVLSLVTLAAFNLGGDLPTSTCSNSTPICGRFTDAR